MKFQLGAMSTGDILDRGLKLLMSRLGTMYAIYLIVMSPMILFQVLTPIVTAQTGNFLLVAMMGLVALVLLLFLSPIGSAAMVRVISQEYVDRRVGMGEALSFAAGRFGILISTSLLAGIWIFLWSLLFVIPGILAALSYSFIGQVVVVEGLGGMAALDRSAALAKGFRGRIAGILFLVAILSGIASGILGAGLELALPAGGQLIRSGTGVQFSTEVNHVNQSIHIVLKQLLSILLSSYSAVCVTLLYFDLRVRKEGYDLEVAASKEADVAEPI